MTTSRRTAAQAAGLLLAGAVVGGVLAATITASAGTPSATRAAAPAPYAPFAPYAGPDGHRGPRPPMQAGTVTAVGTSSVTIKSADGAKTYSVDADSDIDKSGEAKLSDLKTGDAVHFAVRPGTSTIAVLHAGDESKNGPGPGRHHGPCPGMGGERPGTDTNPGAGSSAAPTNPA